MVATKIARWHQQIAVHERKVSAAGTKFPAADI
jgi:hypothetical protein